LKEQDIPVAAFGCDGAFDEIDLWNWLDFMNIRPVIKPDANAQENSKSALRNFTVKWRNKHGYKKWRGKTGYGEWWPATEGIFSAVKVMFGEELHAQSENGLLQEAGLKFWVHQKLKRYGEA